MLFNGTGISTTDWQSTEQIVQSMGLSYQLVDSVTLNAMSAAQMANFKVMIVPGGNGYDITNGLAAATRVNVRQAVRDYGMGYVGFCAGAFVAVGPDANTNNLSTYGFQVAYGDYLPYWYPGGNTSLTAAIVPVSLAGGSTREMMWWGGPSTPAWTSGVLGRYNDGAPSISETWSGKGYVVISGVHPEAPQSWQSTSGTDPDGLDFDIAVKMIQSAMTKAPLTTL